MVGTNYRTYGPAVASWLTRAFSVVGEFGPNYNRSDGLVKQAFAQLPGGPRTFVHKCHGGPDLLVTSREAFEVATRFFFGNIKVRLKSATAKVKRGKDLFGKSEFFLGVSIKPRRVDFELFHQSAEAENCYGPFSNEDLSDKSKDGVSFNWTDGDNGERLIWEGWLDTGATTLTTDRPRDGVRSGDVQKPAQPDDVVLRFDFYLGERDLFGIGFSDNVVLRKQYYARAVFDDVSDLATLRNLCCTRERISRIPRKPRPCAGPALPHGNSTSAAPASTQPSASPSPWSEVGFRPRKPHTAAFAAPLANKFWIAHPTTAEYQHQTLPFLLLGNSIRSNLRV